MATTTETRTPVARITRVYWSIPGVAEGKAPTVRAAESAMSQHRARVGSIAGYVVIYRADGAWERRAA